MPDFLLPELGEGVDSGDVVNVMVSVGDTIAIDDPILEIETDKAVIEVPSSVAGTVTKLSIKVGDVATPGQKILTIMSSATVAEEAPVLAVSPESDTSLATSSTPSDPPPIATAAIPTTPVTIPPAAPSGETNVSGILPHAARPILHELAPAAPSIRRFAREIGIDIRQVQGRGPSGRISVEDVKAFAKALTQETAQVKAFPVGTTAAAAVPVAGGLATRPLPDFSKFGEIDIERMSNVRRATATHLSDAWRIIPHVTQFDRTDWTDTEKLRKQFSKQVEVAGAKFTPTVIILKVLAAAIKKFPDFATSVDMDNQQIVYKKYCHIGVAVDTPRGLLVPVIRDVDQKNLIELSLELGELADKARRGKTSLAEMQGGVITLTNLGGVGGTNFAPIVNWPEVAILGVARGGMEPVYIDGEFQPRLMMPLSLSYDHRVIDGVAGARFLRWICQALEQPFALLVDG